MQLSQFKELKDENLKQKEQIIKNLQEENESLKVELVREKCVSENKSKELLEKNDNIELLNKRIRSSRPTSSYIRKPENVNRIIFSSFYLIFMEIFSSQRQKL